MPFLETDIVEYAFSLLRSYEITAGERKRVPLRSHLGCGLLKIRNRGKKGFDIPIGECLRGSIAAEFRKTVWSDPMALLDTEVVLLLFEHHREDHRNHIKFLWSVYVFARWNK